jgi:hypothetical protein
MSSSPSRVQPPSYDFDAGNSLPLQSTTGNVEVQTSDAAGQTHFGTARLRDF